MTIPEIVVAVDPGGTTGVACWMGDDRFLADEHKPLAACARVDRFLQGYGEQTLVVCEAYVVTQQTIRNTRQNDALEVIGAMRYLAWKYGATFGGLQQPSAAKRIVTNDRLRALNMWTVGKGHANDAARHVVLALLERGWYSSVLTV